ncbi:MAG: superoxide dismutase [Desulfobacterales bacterium]|nr:superoxide dismutase [Desulfobacterales bacterium]
MKNTLQIFATILMVLFSINLGWSHCEIPCGIYDDQMRIHMVAEHIKTIEKSMNEIIRLQAEEPKNYNQIVRWIMNKEDHADMLQDIVNQYFMTQRIKIDDDDYTKKLVVLHKMIVYAMKCKQTVDLSHIETLRNLLKQFSELYFGHDDSEKGKKSR